MNFSFLIAICLSLILTFFDELEDMTHSKLFLPLAFGLFVYTLFYLSDEPGLTILMVAIIIRAYHHVLKTS